MGREVRHWNRATVEAPSWMVQKQVDVVPVGTGVSGGLGCAAGQLKINDLRGFSNLNDPETNQQQLLRAVIHLSDVSVLGHSLCNSGSGGAAKPQTWNQSSPNEVHESKIPGHFQFGSCALNFRDF